MDEQEIIWSSPEFHVVERSSNWYLASLVVAAAIAIFCLFQKNFLFLLFVIIAETTLLFMTKQKPKLFGYEITSQGITVDDVLVYKFSEMNGFAIVDDGVSMYVELVIRPIKKLGQYGKILLPRVMTGEVFAVLSRYTSEFKYEETMTESMIKRIGL